METSVHADAESVWKYSSFGTFARQYNEIAKGVKHYLKHAPLNLFDVEKLPGLGDSHALVQKQIFESTHASLSMLIGYLEQKVGVTESEVDSLRNFIQANLRRVIFKVPEREFEVQDAIESLLVGRGMAKGLDYDRETGRVKVSVKESVPDFIFPQLSHALEVKLSKSKPANLVDEINADIRSYSTRYSSLLFVVYDLGTIRDDAEFRSGLETAGKVAVIIVKH